jgi:hypothetical protein
MKAFVGAGAHDADTANDAVPNKEPVIPFVTISVFNAASDPLMSTFFHDGIFYLIMIGYRIVSAHFPFGSIIYAYKYDKNLFTLNGFFYLFKFF